MALAEHRTGTMTSGDVEIFYRAFGATGAMPVLIVHGLSFFSYDWIGVADRLAVDREVVAMDMRGFGDSSWSADGNYAIGDFSQDCINLIDHLGWDRVVLMGHSMGGRNATWCAAANPARFPRLVLVDYSPQNAPAGSNRVATTVAGVPEHFDSVEQGMAYFGANAGDPVQRARYDAYLKRTDGGYIVKRDTVHRDRFRKVLAGEAPAGGPDMWDALARVQCPTLVVRGTRSDMFATETADKVRSTNDAITLVEVDAGHDVAGDNPEALLDEIGRFLAKME
jgi:pimeloyl-ACP methyl ester carboxylesterase